MKPNKKFLCAFPVILGAAIILAAFSFSISSCGKKGDQPPTTEKKQTAEQTNLISKSDSAGMMNAKYACPMHPLERSNEPGKCPICKMKLESITELRKEMMDEHEAMEKKHAGMKNMKHFEINFSPVNSDECEKLIRDALKKDPGVVDFHIDIIDHVIHMYIDNSKTEKKKVEQLVADAGFDANETKANPDARNKLPANCR
jgi:mercuric ion binding protein